MPAAALADAPRLQGGEEPTSHSGETRWLTWGLLLVAVAPVLTAAVLASVNGWKVTGDDALLALRSFDVFTAHPPLLGSGSSASKWSGLAISNIGPLQFVLLAVPVRLFGASPGVIWGSAFINSASIAVVGLVARRRGGHGLMFTALLAMVLLGWAMGPGYLIEIWQPYACVLPFCAYLFAVWAAADGDVRLLPVAVFIGSFLLQMHLSFVLLVPVTLGPALVAVVVRGVRHRRDGSDQARATRSLSFRSAGVSALLGLVLFVPTLWQQVFYRPGNLTNLAKLNSMTGGPPPTPKSFALRDLGSVLALPPWFGPNGWDRPTFHAYLFTGYAYGAGITYAALGVLLLAVLAMGVWGVRSDRSGAAVAAVAILLTIAAGFVSLTQAKLAYGVIAGYMRWAWALSLFVWVQLVWWVAQMVGARRHGSGSAGRWRTRPWAAMVVLAALVLVSDPFSYRGQDVVSDSRTSAYGLIGQALPRLAGAGPLLIHASNDLRTSGPEPAFMVRLAETGHRFYSDRPDLATQIGSSRVYSGQPVATIVWFVWGPGARHVPTGVRRLAFVPGLTALQAARLRLLRAELVRVLAGPEPFDPKMVRMLERAQPGALAAARAAPDRPAALLGLVERYPFLVSSHHPRFADFAEDSQLAARSQQDLALFAIPGGSPEGRAQIAADRPAK